MECYFSHIRLAERSSGLDREESGRQIKAEIVKVYSSREVVLKKENRQTITIPFDILFLLMLSTLNISLNTAIVDFFIQFIGRR